MATITTTPTSMMGSAIIRDRPRREAACLPHRRHGTIDVALQNLPFLMAEHKRKPPTLVEAPLAATRSRNQG
jgi:hypothetical protein